MCKEGKKSLQKEHRKDSVWYVPTNSVQIINHYLGMAERIKVNLRTRPAKRKSAEDAMLEPLTSSDSDCEVTETERRVVRLADDPDKRGNTDWFLDLLDE